MGRLRRRLDGLEQHAHATMSGADELVALAKDLLNDLADGVQVEVTIPHTGIPLLDGLIDKHGGKLPFTLRIDPREGVKS